MVRNGTGLQVEGPAHPRPARVDHAPRRDRAARAGGPVDQHRLPPGLPALERHALGAGAYIRSAQVGVAGVEHDQARVLHPAVGVLERPPVARLQRGAARVPGEVHARRGRQQRSPADVVVEEETQPDQPPGPQPVVVREHEAQRPDDVRGVAQQHLALLQRVAHEAKLALLQVPEPAVDELGAGGRRMGAQVVLLAQQDVEAPARRVGGRSPHR